MTDTARTLVGFMNEGEALHFLRTQCQHDNRSDDELRGMWTSASAAVAGIQPVDLSADEQEIPAQFNSLLAAAEKNPVFPEAVAQRKWSFKLVEIDKLVCFQKFILERYEGAKPTDAEFQDLGKLIEFCLPTQPVERAFATAFNPQEKSYTLYAQGQDLRVLLFDPRGAALPDPVRKRSHYGFWVGFGSPLVQVAKFGGRFILKNGYHRVYEIRKHGRSHVPCILIENQSIEEVYAQVPGFFPRELVLSDRPPLFRHYFDDAISGSQPFRVITKVIRIHAEEFTLFARAETPGTTRTAAPTETKAVEPPAAKPRIDFAIETEGWDVYRLGDGTILKLRQVLLSAERKHSAGDNQMDINIRFSELLQAPVPPPALKGSPDNTVHPPQELLGSIVEKDIKFESITKSTNTYRIEGVGRLQVALDVRSVSRTDKFNEIGDPIYLVESNSTIGLALDGQ